MNIINLTYIVPLETVDAYSDSHVEYLKEQYKLGHFLASGRKVPRTGGIILSGVSYKAELQKIIEKDPFKVNDIADYALTEFVPSMTSEELKFLKE
jgi:uncharacterized protein YciI